VVQAFADQAAIAIENARLYQEAAAHQRQLATMVDVAQKLTSRLDFSSVLDTVATAAAEVFGADVGFRLIEGDELVLKSATPGAREKMVRQRLKIGESISGRVAACGEPIVTTNVPADLRAIPEHRRGGSQTDALMCVPVRGGSRILGTLNIYRERGQRFDDAALSLAMSLADQAGVALENARLYGRSLQQAERTKALADVTRLLLSETLDVELVARRIADSIRALLNVHHAVIFRVESTSGDLVALACTDELAQALGRDVRFPAGIGAVGRAVEERRIVTAPNALTDPRIILTPELRRGIEQAPWRAVLGLPLVIGERVIGAVGVGDREGRVFDEEEIRLAEAFADQAGVALENARLYREAQQAYADLSRAQQQLLQSQKVEAIGRLAGGIAHEFNNLLAVILGRGELLLLRLPASDRSWRDIDTIKKTAERAAALTRQLLAFGRRQMLQPRALDLNAVVSGMHAMVRQLIGADIDLQAVLDPHAGTVMADPGQLEQMLVNLAINARDAMPAGGRLTIETRNAFLDEAFVRDTPGASQGAHAFVRISDSGVGIDPAIQSNIFEPFFTTKPRGQGTGLGLSTVDGIVRQHGGFITLQSELGQGATFTVYLPRASTSGETRPTSTAQPKQLPRGRETILLAEDEEEVRSLVCDILQDMGFTVLAAANGMAALELCRQYSEAIDLLLTDMVMPGMSGTELAQHVRRSHPETKVVYMSGYSEHPSGRSELFSIDGPMLAKPFTRATLAEMVRRMLDAG